MAKKTPVRYTDREFSSIRSALVNYAKRYYPEQIKDFSDASFASFMIDSVAYVGDMLSFYLDYQANEGFINTAGEYNNLIKLGRQLGYKFKGRPSSYGLAQFYVMVPANAAGLGPDENYIPTLLRGSEFSSESGASFLLTEDVKFSKASNQTVVGRVDETTGVPTYYAIRAPGTVVSGRVIEESYTIGNFEKFLRVKLADPNCTEILSVFDQEGHEYFEVDYLSNNVIYKDIANYASDSNLVPSVLRPFVAARRFVFERENGSSYLQFGYGSEDEATSPSVAEPSTVVLNMHGKNYKTDEFFDPSKLLDTDKFGIGPSNTTITIKYRIVDSSNINVPSQSLTNTRRTFLGFDDPTQLVAGTVTTVRNSIEVSNEEPILGSVSIPTSEELRRRIFDTFATQDRAVTTTDMEAFVYAMPPHYGAIKRCKVVKDSDSFKRNINLYVLAEGSDGALATATTTLKENLKMWLNSRKMVHDTIDVMNGRIINVGIEFTIIADPDHNKTEVLSECTRLLREKFKQPKYLGEPLSITEIYSTLSGKVRGLLDVKKVKYVKKTNGSYSTTSFDMNTAKSADGRYIVAPLNAAFEIKYPTFDIKGAAE